jgi:hypothetical protein
MSEDVMAAIDVMAYGYKVTVWINGIDIGVQGGKSESKRLFGANHSMVSELPEQLKNLACLKSGENELKIEYKRLKDEGSTGLTVEVKSEEQFANDEHVFFHREDPNENYDLKSITGKFKV